jgi:hypothetical protein
MSRLLTAMLLLSVVSIMHAQNCMPIAPDATDSTIVGQNITK